MEQSLTPAQMLAFLAARNIVGPSAQAKALSGGVSNDVVLVTESGVRKAVVKHALGRLRVAEEWLAPAERVLDEADSLEVVNAVLPGTVPRVLAVDRQHGVIAIEAAPPSWSDWKSHLLACEVDEGLAARLGGWLASLHRATCLGVGLPVRFASHQSFFALRISPYHLTSAERLPEIAPAISRVVDELDERVCLVHGDFSPKNVLFGDGGFWIIDFEVAHLGAPVFDVAFMLTHLALKSIYLEARAPAFRRAAIAFLSAYKNGRPPSKLTDELIARHTGALLVARVVGKSPAEYLDEVSREQALLLGRELLSGAGGSRLSEFLE